ncbi:MAG: MmcQ/YjbR family DNA-binding protein [Christensenellaceae bacterium]|jgi:predicted DNA-binding protein (MmcQ/YjbR family)|nr:MmcQ/YjbR family DNA-binding protein [Christensenellaceae bacterium]
MTKRELIDICLKFENVYEDYPFDTGATAAPESWAVIRHIENRKSFALIYVMFGKLRVNLKCEPAEADFLRNVFYGVIPAYHMNKNKWNTVEIDSDVPHQELLRQIENSYNLTKEKRCSI